MNSEDLIDLFLLIIAIILFIIGSSIMAEANQIKASTYKSDYDTYFSKYSKRFFGVQYNWLWFKSQGMAESNLDPKAESWVGAKGVMQLMPDTHKEIRQELNIPDAIYSPRWNIAGGIYYDKKLYNQWTAPRPEQDRREFMFASYNGGLGNILKAQQQCVQTCQTCHNNECNLWENVKRFGKEVNTWIHEETLGYVERINRFMGVVDSKDSGD